MGFLLPIPIFMLKVLLFVSFHGIMFVDGTFRIICAGTLLLLW